MTRSKIAFPAAVLATLALALVPSVAANPCSAPCGEVVVVFDCVTFTATAEGSSSFMGTQWSFTVRESTNWGWSRTDTQTSTGAAAVFQHSDVRAWTGYYKVEATLSANGQVLDSMAVVCL